MSPKKYIPNDLFCPGGNINLNAAIGTNGGPYDYGDYAHGFLSAASDLVSRFEHGDHIGLFVDTAVYPIVACYRQGLELWLKHLIVIASRISGSEKDFPKSHKLEELWGILKEVERKFDDGLMPNESREHLEFVITEFTKIDPIGMVFRYPEDRSRNLVIDTFQVLSLDVLRSYLDPAGEILMTLGDYLREISYQSQVSNNSTSGKA